MATGTGTEQDPYLVSTLEDFITCVKINNAYVKVVANIVPPASNEYPIYDTITFADVVTVYADTPKKISGFIIKGSHCLGRGSTSGTITIRNINFQDILFKPIHPLPYIIYGSNYNQWDFYNCKISIRTAFDESSPICTSGANFHQCSLYFDFIGTNIGIYSSQIPFNNTNFYESIVELKDCPYKYQNSQNSLIKYSEFSIFKFLIKKYYTGNPEIIIFSDATSHDNIVIISQELTEGINNYHTFRVYGTSQLVDTEASQNSSFVFANSAGRNHLLTTAQIQSESYLREIGFIP